MTGVPLTISDFEYIRQIGRGSYGEVWLARSVTGVYRAIKVVYRQRFEDARPYEREFEGIKRFEPISRSQPNLVDILHVGRRDDQSCFYYVMELADPAESDATEPSPDLGAADWAQRYRPKTLRAVLTRRRRLPVEQCLWLATGLARAVGHLHEHGLIHRDVKPSNIIFVNDIPKLADIGLIAGVEESRSFVGTEGFVPPEGPGTPAADLFSLGKVLYEVSTGRDRLDFPKLPEDFDHLPNPQAFLEFNEIVLKSCHPKLKERYASAKDLLDDLLLLQAGRSVRRLRLVEKRLARLVPAGLAFVGLAGTLLLIQHFRTKGAEEIARVESNYRRQAEAQALTNRQLLYAADMNLAHQAFAVGDLGRTRNLLSGHIPGPGERDLRGFEWRYYWKLSQGDQRYTFPAQARPVAALVFSPDGLRFASAGYDNQATVWDFGTRQLLKTYRTSGAVEDVGFSPDGRLLIICDETGMVEAKDLNTDRMTFRLRDTFRHMAVSPIGARLALGSGGKQFVLNQGPALVWDYEANRQVFSLPEAGTYVAFSPDGRRLATGSWNREIKLWDMDNGALLVRLGPVENNFGMSFTPDGRKLVVGDESGFIKVWDLENSKELAGVQGHLSNIFKTGVSPDGRWLVSVSADQTIRLWNPKDLSRLGILRGHVSEVWGLAFSPDSQNLISSGKDGTVRVWQLDRPAQAGIPTRDVAFWHWPVFSDDGRLVAVGSKASGVTLWRVSDGASAGAIGTAERPVAFLTNSDTLLTLGRQGELQRWNIHEPQPTANGCVQLGATGVFAHVFIKNRSLLITGDQQGDVRMWNVLSGAESGSWKTHSSRLVSMSVSPDYELLATVNENENDAKVWDLASHQLKMTLSGHKLAVYSVTFSPDGQTLATASVDDTAGLWEARTGKNLAFLGGHKGGTYSVAFSTDGRTLAVGCNEGELKLWNVDTKRDMITLVTEPHAIFSTCFSPDGQALSTVSFNHHNQDCSFKLWHAPWR